jgi:hypothetical protein
MALSASDTGVDGKEATLPPGGGDGAQAIARKALDKIDALHLKPLPQIYELWFRYFESNPEIVQAVDNHQGPLDEMACHKLYKRHLSESAREDAVT